MRKLNGITIGGEFLGNSVVINCMFRAICAISPIIMRDFVYIIKNTEQLKEAVKIITFNCPDNNSIYIEFSNSTIEGFATLYYTLQNSELKLSDCNLVVGDEEIINTTKDIKEFLEIYSPEDINELSYNVMEEFYSIGKNYHHNVKKPPVNKISGNRQETNYPKVPQKII